MGRIQIRHSVAYQADYLSLKGIDKDKVMADLTNIVLLNNIEGSAHLSGLIDYKAFGDKRSGGAANIMKDLLFSLVGIPYIGWLRQSYIQGSRQVIDTSMLSDTYRDNFNFVVEKNKEKVNLHLKLRKDVREEITMEYNEYVDEANFLLLKQGKKVTKKQFNEDIIGVVFLHSLMYESEIQNFLLHLNACFNNSTRYAPFTNPFLTKEYINKGKRESFYNDSIESVLYSGYWDNEKNVKLQHINNIVSPQFDKPEPKIFTLMIPVYESLDFLRPVSSIYTKQTYLREHGLLNWYVEPFVRGHQTITIDPFLGKDMISNVSIHLTYFPPNIAYYNKYVESMVTAPLTNFTKSPILNSCFNTIESTDINKIWKSLLGLFAFTVSPENLLCTMNINRYAGVMNNTINQLNYVDNVIINNTALARFLLFLCNFMVGTPFSSHLMEVMDSTTKDTNNSLLKAIKKLTIQIDILNEVSVKNNIPAIISEGLKNSLIYHIFYIALPDLIEYNLSSRHKRRRRIIWTLEGKKTDEKWINIESLYGTLPYTLQSTLSMIIRTHETEESINIISEAIRLYHSYLKDCFLTFITLNKDYREIVESTNIGKATPYIQEILKNIPNTNYDSFKQQFFQGGYSLIRVASVQKQFGIFLQKQITSKYKNTDLLGKRAPEYRLFDEILKQYKAEPIKLFGIKDNSQEWTGLSGMFYTKTYTELLTKKLPFNKHIQKLAEFFETIFKFSRII